jgi:hypothetical protein
MIVEAAAAAAAAAEVATSPHTCGLLENAERFSATRSLIASERV